MNTKTNGLIATIILLAVCALLAAGAVGEGFTTIKARAATATFERAVTKADAEHAQTIDAAQRAYAANLAEAKADATRAGNLDEAVRIRDAIDALKAGTASAKPLDARLAGTRWAWHKDGRDTGVRVVFFGGGVYQMIEPDGAKRSGRWRIVSIAHVEAVNPRGVAMEFTFNQAADAFMAIAEGGEVRIGQRVQ